MLRENICYLSLHHEASVVTHAADKVKDVDVPLLLYPLQLREECDEGARPPHAGAAVDHNGGLALPGGRHHHASDKLQESGGVVGDPMVRPDGEVELRDNPLVRSGDSYKTVGGGGGGQNTLTFLS